MQHAFIVGCPRSGSTLVQAMLARHPDVLSLPETAFFEHLCGDLPWRWGDRDARPRRRPLRQRLGLAPPRARCSLQALDSRSGLMGWRWPAWPLRTRTCARRFVALLDAQARARGRAMWVEKTPCHLLYIPEIERHVPGARFIHVIRPGEDVLASIADANLRYEGNAAFDGGTVLWTRRWNRAAQIHHEYARQPNHHFVFLDDLLADGEREWRRLCGFLDLATVAPRADEDLAVADLRREPWKRDALSGLPAKPQRKAEKVFGPELRAWLRRKLMPYEALRHHCMAGLSRPSRVARLQSR